jgi:uncharacterized protein
MFMDIKPLLSRITIFPVKSLDGMDLQQAEIAIGGCLKHDRSFAIFDQAGRKVNGKSNPLVHTLRSRFDPDLGLLSFQSGECPDWQSFYWDEQASLLDEYLSGHFGLAVHMVHEPTGRLLDIPDISGATVLSTSSLEEVSSWMDGMDIAETRRRFRATLEISGVPAFWEDMLFARVGVGVVFNLGDVSLIGMSPRARCVVPTRDTHTGQVAHGFAKRFSERRADRLPGWSNLEEFGHFYHLSVDCALPDSEVGKTLRVGDALTIIGEQIIA